MLTWQQREALRDSDPKNREYIERRNELISVAIALTKQTERATPKKDRKRFNWDLCFHKNMADLAYAEGLSAYPHIERD